MNNEELNNLKSVVDDMHIQIAKVTVKQETMLSMILGVYFETLPQANAKQIAEKLFSLLQVNLDEALDGLRGELFDSGKILRSKMEVLSEIQCVRNSFGLSG